jgi:DNA-directed RNA polymerase specialized sigma24 family protein
MLLRRDLFVPSRSGPGRVCRPIAGPKTSRGDAFMRAIVSNAPREHLTEIARIEPVHIEARVNHDLRAVDLSFADEHGSGFGVLFGPEAAADLIIRMNTALADLAGGGGLARMTEAQRLITVLRDAFDMRQREIARRLNVGAAAISMWKFGKQAPTEEHLQQLRNLVRGVLRSG